MRAFFHLELDCSSRNAGKSQSRETKKHGVMVEESEHETARERRMHRDTSAGAL